VADLLLAGLGNIGLPLADDVARLPGIRSLILVDPDNFEPSNVSGQPITPGCAGLAKVDVARDRIKEINPALVVEAWKSELQALPRGLFRGRIVISALDNLVARAALSEICFSVRSEFWLDTGVRPDGRIIRVSAISPRTPEAACLCCGWSKEWDALSTQYSCDGSSKRAPTRSPAYLGALCAAVAAHLLECHLSRTLGPRTEVVQQMISLASDKTWKTIIRRNPGCRCSHQSLEIEELGASASACTLRDLGREHATLLVPGLPLVRRLGCSCGAERSLLFVAARLKAEQLRCTICSELMRYGAVDLLDEVQLSLSALDEEFGPETHALTLAALGIADRDIVRLGDHRYFDVGAGPTTGRR